MGLKLARFGFTTVAFTLTVNSSLLTESKQIYLLLDGVDTVANVFVNGFFVGSTENMFVQYRYDINRLLKRGDNELTVKILSSIVYAKNQANQYVRNYSYPVPPLNNPPEYHGEDNVNFVRKMQASFAWDWGPAFPSAGIWKSVRLEVIRSVPVLRDFTAITFQTGGRWFVKTKLYVDKPDYDRYRVLVAIDLGDRSLFEDFIEVTGPLEIAIDLPDLELDFDPKLWWPNGLERTATDKSRTAALYELKVTWRPKDCTGTDCSSITKRVGFRQIDLIQESLPNALSFRFQVNNHSIFVRGTNIIPVSIFPEVSPENYIRHLLMSVKRANMNMVRIWGGGIYQSQFFYDLADELGIMIWQDFMFACALYPNTKRFLQNVQLEVIQQLEALQHHPSIAVWAGNNENEAAYSQRWWKQIETYKDIYKEDYLALYFDTIGTTLRKYNPHANFIPSSPSNGLETIMEGGIAKVPGDFRYGDVHFYDYYHDVWDWKNYPSAKFVSEYGIESYPSVATLLSALPANKLTLPLSKELRLRQHHPNGDEELRTLIGMHMNLPAEGGLRQFSKYVYLSQILQAVAIKRQTEFYIRNRFLNKTSGWGLTYGAMYWQLNDVWQAPSWSSIEYGGKWKMLHYYMVNTFTPANAFVYEDDGMLNIVLINDYLNPVSIELTASVQRYADLVPVTLFKKSFERPKKGVSFVYSETLDKVLGKGWCASENHCIIKLEVKHMIAGRPETVEEFENFHLLSSPKKIKGLTKPGITVEKVKQIQSSRVNKFQINLSSNSVAMFVWLTLDSASRINAIFSDNGFMMLAKNKTVYLETVSKISPNDLAKILKVTHLLDNMELSS